MKNNFCLIFAFLFVSISVCGQAVWRQCQGPYSGEMISFTANEGNLFCAGQLSAIFMSNDGGDTWQETGMDYGNTYFLYSFNSKIFACVKNSVYVSRNNGLDWEKCTGIGSTRALYEFNGCLFATGYNGVFVYNEATNSWTSVNSELNGNTFASVGDVLFCGTYGDGLHFTEDLGKTWEKVPEQAGIDISSVYHLISFKDKLILSIWDSGPKVVFSNDAGKSWSEIEFSNSDIRFNGFARFQENLILATTDAVYQLNETNLTFEVFSNKTFGYVFSDGSGLFGSNRSGLYKWNETDFVLSNTGINSARVNDLAIINNNLYCATDGGAFYSTHDGDTWNMIEKTKDYWCSTIESINDKVFIGTDKGVLYSSRNQANWQSTNNGLGSETIWKIKAVNNVLFAATDAGLYKSTDEGQSWEHVRNYDSQIQSIAAENDLVLVAPGYYTIYKVSRDKASLEAFVSLNDGIHVIEGGNSSPQLISFDDTNVIENIHVFDGVIYLSIGNAGLFKSYNNGITWERNSDVRSQDLTKRGDSNFYAVWYGDVYTSMDDGKTWTNRYESGLSGYYANRILHGENKMFVGTLGKGVYAREYLTDTELFSDSYSVNGSIISNVTGGVTIEELKSNLYCSYGASIFISQNSPSTNSTANEIRTIKVVAEDGITEKVYTIDYSTNIGELVIGQVEIYPNPANSVIFVKSDFGAINRVQVYDMQGELLIEKDDVKGGVNIGSLAQGFYYVKIIHSEGSSSQKFLKQ